MLVSGFFSYAHGDNAFDVLTNLHHDLCDEFKRVSGNDFNLFIDHDSIEWGQRWREAINRGIDGASFFIPMLSPLYLLSPSCQQEMMQYLSMVKAIHAEELFMPILITDISKDGLELDKSLVEEVLKYQYYDARALNSLDRGSGPYRRMLRELAEKLYKANMTLSEKSTAAAKSFDADGGQQAELGNQPFFLDSIGEIEPKMSLMKASLEEIGEDMEKIGAIAVSKTPELERASGGANPARDVLVVLTQVSNEIAPVADLFEQHAKDYQRQANELDIHIRVIANVADATQAEGVEEFWSSMGEAANSSLEAKDSLVSFRERVMPLQRVSRVLYKPMRTIERALNICLGALDVSIAWGELRPVNENAAAE